MTKCVLTQNDGKRSFNQKRRCSNRLRATVLTLNDAKGTLYQIFRFSSRFRETD